MIVYIYINELSLLSILLVVLLLSFFGFILKFTSLELALGICAMAYGLITFIAGVEI